MDDALFQKVFTQGPVSIFRWKNITGEWPVAEVTANVEELTGWSAGDFLDGKINYADLIHPEDLERVGAEEDAWKQTRSRKGINMKYRIVTRSGETRRVSEFTQNVFDSDGEVPYLVGYIMDVTGQHESEEARRAAEAAERSKAEFLANMSHEIRTPMNGVMGMAELLSKTELDNKQRSFTNIILRSGSALVTIMNDILDFSKIEAGQLRLDCEPFELKTVVEEVTTLISSSAAEKDLEIIVRLAPGLPRKVIGDAGRLRQIITNLLTNAVKFTEEGHVLVDVGGTVGAEKLRLDVRIQDTGMGIPADKCETIFEKFSQVDGSATRKHEGTGLGLSIAASLVDLMDGEIGVDSSLGRGSTFWFNVRLPIEEAGAEVSEVPEDLVGSRILVVDDNDVNRAILQEQMTGWRFDSAAATNGPHALAVLEAAAGRGIRVDALILDYHMPDMDGADVARAIRGNTALSDLPIIMLTSVDQTAEGESFSSLGIQGHLVKPARFEQLLSTIVRVLHEAKGETGNATAEPSAGAGREPTDEELLAMPIPRAADGVPVTPPAAQAEPETIDVLVAEDNEVNQLLFEQILEGTSYSFIIADHGKHAVELYERHRPRVICMDVSMPVMNGLDATREIRELEKSNGLRTPVIAVTAHALKGDMERCFDAGMDDYLPKPISPHELESKLDHWLAAGTLAKSA
ncbi:MAG: response regulator [Pseudomonadota bacterium]